MLVVCAFFPALVPPEVLRWMKIGAGLLVERAAIALIAVGGALFLGA